MKSAHALCGALLAAISGLAHPHGRRAGRGAQQQQRHQPPRRRSYGAGAHRERLSASAQLEIGRLAVIGVGYVSIMRNELMDLLVETIRSGPEG